MLPSTESASLRAKYAYALSLTWIAVVFALGDWNIQVPVWSGIPGLCVAKMNLFDPQSLAESGAWGWATLQVARLIGAGAGWGGGPSMVWESFKRWGGLMLAGGGLALVLLAVVALSVPGLGLGLDADETRAVLVSLDESWQIAGPAFLAQGCAELLMIAAYAIGARAKPVVEKGCTRKAWESCMGVPIFAGLLWATFAVFGPAKLVNVDCSEPEAIHTKPEPFRAGPRVQAPRNQA